jgi:hypothetical protein
MKNGAKQPWSLHRVRVQCCLSRAGCTVPPPTCNHASRHAGDGHTPFCIATKKKEQKTSKKNRVDGDAARMPCPSWLDQRDVGVCTHNPCHHILAECVACLAQHHEAPASGCVSPSLDVVRTGDFSLVNQSYCTMLVESVVEWAELSVQGPYGSVTSPTQIGSHP